jgi:hypothetical protein
MARSFSRRRFVAWLSSAVPIVLVARRADALAANWLAEDEATMRALAATVLPSELGRDGAAAVGRDFQRWIDNYRENTELVHGYGTSALRFTRASPRPKWAAQLESLKQSGFNDKSIEQRRQVVQDLMANERLDRMPDVVGAPHVAIALLAFFYGSSQAADLCYESRIGRETCRPLSLASRKPLPIASRGARP